MIRPDDIYATLLFDSNREWVVMFDFLISIPGSEPLLEIVVADSMPVVDGCHWQSRVYAHHDYRSLFSLFNASLCDIGGLRLDV